MKGKFYFAILAVFFGWHHLWGADYMEREYSYPLRYKETIVTEGRASGVSPALIGAVILAESKFKEDAHSSTGAKGLMQLMPETAKWITTEMRAEKFSEGDLENGEKNIRIGTWYLSYLLREFHGNQILALAAYNAGRGHVEEWMQLYQWDYTFSDIDAIPFLETREYIKKVQTYKKEYEVLYKLR